MGVKVKKNKRSGKLAFRVFWRGFPNGRSWETTELLDTPDNRALMQARAVIMAAEIKEGTFDYLKWFPYGTRAAFFAGKASVPRSLSDYFNDWIKGKKPPLERKSLFRDYNQHWNGYISDALGAREIVSIAAFDLKTIKNSLIESGLTVKTVKNIVGGTLRALLRDAQIDGVIARSPFEDLPRKGWWPRVETPAPNPMQDADRRAICQWFYKNDRHYWPFVSFHLYQSVRPSESTALTWGAIDVEAHLAMILKSRDLGATAATKTPSARRVIHLKPHIAEILRQAKPLRAEATTPVFLNKLGKVMDADEFRNNQWHRALRVLEIAPRDFYSCKDTVISLDIMAGENIKKVAQEAGISLVTLERHYGMFIEKSATESATEKLKSGNAVKSKRKGWRPRRDLNPLDAPLSQPAKSLSTSPDYDEKAVISEPDAVSDKGGKKGARHG